MKYNHFNLIPLIVAFSLVVSCDFFGPSGLTSVEIKKASSWSLNDQPPTFPECETLDKKQQLDCLQEILSNIIMDQIAMSSPISSVPLDEEVKLILKIEAIRSHGRVWKYKGEAFVEGKKMADAQWSATIVDRK